MINQNKHVDSQIFTKMSENQSGDSATLAEPAPLGHVEEKIRQNQAPFILQSPNGSPNKSTSSDTIKKTKYEKLAKLLSQELAKKSEIQLKQVRLDELRSKYEDLRRVQEQTSQVKLAENQEQTKLTEQLQGNLIKLREQNSEESNRSEDISKQLETKLAEIEYQIQEQITKKRDICTQGPNHNVQISQKTQQKTELLQKNQAIGQQLQMKKMILNKVLEEQAKSKQSINDMNRGDLSQTQSNLEQQLIRIQSEIAEKKNKISSIPPQESSSEKIEHLREDLLEEKQSHYEQLQKQLKVLIEGTKAEQEYLQDQREKMNQNDKRFTQAQGTLKQLRKEEKQHQNKIEKLRQQTKDKSIEAPAEYLEAKERNEAISQQLQELQAQYNSYQQKDANLVPSNVVQKQYNQLQKAKNYYEANKNISDKLKKMEAEIQENMHEKQQLEWETNPAIKNLEETNKKESARISILEEEIKALQKESTQVSNKLEQFVKQYPEFEIQQKKKKLQRKQAQKREQTQKKEEPEQDSKKKKAKKGKKV